MAHHHLYRVEELARYFASGGCRVVVHVDLQAPSHDFEALKSALSDTGTIFAARQRCEWGTFALHNAAMEASRLLIDTFEDIDHVCLISGSCLPIQSLDKLKSCLAANPDTDFVESRLIGVDDWVHEGLSEERFTLYFPFGWRSNRWLFDRAVDIQRLLRVNRTVPAHLQIAVGSQWWTLSRGTLRRILDDPKKRETDAYFRKCWIVDESYVQTMVRTHSRTLVNRSLCLTEFDPQGIPFTFYDDHAHLLQRDEEHFFARKIWHGATGLYNKYLRGVEPMAAARRPRGGSLKVLVNEGRENRCLGRPGLLMQSRFPVQAFERQHRTARPYLVLDGFDFVYQGITQWQKSLGLPLVHDRLFAKDAVKFADDAKVMPGGIVANPRIRDWNTEQFLTNLIWNARDRQQSFQFHVSDSTRIASFLLKDPNANILFIKGAWAVGMTPNPGETSAQFRRRTMRLKLLEKKHIEEIEGAETRANVQSWTLGEVMADPALPLNALAAMIEGGKLTDVESLPTMRHEHGLGELALNMPVEGVQISNQQASHTNVSQFKRPETA
ncbi:beta-1,6-N-acetylglucosaminyltransferase [Pontivivens nitratireducens]|uniref:beta-1,6-N-acetylglucosaminyltransferase n=1 Tax=Pontivivens nitratireducens TaxID=2758038 RepID=UPI001C8E756F|nr:beta-1,6-N-acetylglucosaminyltransferase [Pontibrevibacter nitratireducens]